MGSVLSDTHHQTTIMHSLSESYQSALQIITAVEQSSAVSGTTSMSGNKMKPDDLMNFFIEVQHCIINSEHSKNGDSALTVQVKRGKQGWRNKGEKPKSLENCENCG